MLTSIKRKNSIFKVDEFEYNNLYYSMSFKGSIYGYCHAQITDFIAYIHLYIDKLGCEALKEMRKDFDIFKKQLRCIGVRLIAGSHEMKGALKWSRFIRLLGFSKPQTTELLAPGRTVMLAVMEI